MLYPISLYSADPAPGNKPEIILDDVSGGLATTLPAYKISKQFSPYMRNLIIDNGKLEKPNGFIAIGSTNTLRNFQGIFPYYDDNGVVSYYVTDSSIVLRTNDYNFYTFVSSAHNTGVIMRGIQARSKEFFSNGVDFVFEHDSVNGKIILNGQNGTPNVPKGKYQIYYLERLWEFNLPNNPSEACYSDVKSTNGVAIALDNFLAWPPGNCLFIGQGDGQAGTAMWIQNGQLQFGKERSIYTLFGTNAGSFVPRKSADIGVASQDSVVMMDNQVHFVGQDGIYRDASRISDIIKPENESINRDSTKVLQNSWDSQLDFAKGNFSGSTATIDGFLTMNNRDFFLNRSTYASSPFPSDRFLELSSTETTTTGFGIALSTGNVPLQFYGYFYSIPLLQRSFRANIGGGGCDSNITLTVKNLKSGLSSDYINSVNGENFSFFNYTQETTPNPAQVFFTADELTNSSFAIRMAVSAPQVGCVYQYYPSTTTGFADIQLKPSTTFQYISDVSTLNMVTGWGNFDSVRNTNGGNISFYERTSTSVVNIATKTWAAINPGVTISEPLINNFIQWASTIASINSLSSASIDNVTIDHIEGAGAVNRPFAINWKNRYWLFVSTSSDPNLSLLLLKSRTSNSNPDAWMPQEGINIRAIAKDNANTLYGGSSSTGIAYRLDYGTNYNGMPINSIYQTPEQFFSDLTTEKNLIEYYLTADQQPGKTLGLNLYVNGTLKNSNSYSLDGTGRTNRVIQNVIGKGKIFKWEFINNQLDKGMDVTNFGVNYQDTGVRKGANE